MSIHTLIGRRRRYTARAPPYPCFVIFGDPWWVWLVGLGFASPWIAASIWLWRKTPRDGALPPSTADLVRKRLWIR